MIENVVNLPEKKEDELLQRAKDDLILFGRLFLKGDFGKSETPEFHREIASQLNDSSTNKQLAIIIARGHGKTTLIKAYILQQFLYNQFYDRTELPLFFGWVSDSLSKSYRNVSYIKEQLSYNDRIRHYFGDMKGDKWTEQDIRLANGCTLISRSNAKSIRGETSGTVAGGSQRYHRIILDDIENEDNTRTFEAREKLKNVFTDAVYPALDVNLGRLIFAGTPVHNDSVCQNILDGHKKAIHEGKGEEYSWRVISYAATQPNMEGGVLWNSYFPRAKLEERRKFYEDMGRLPGYYQEYELQPSGGSARIWTKDHYIVHNAIYNWDPDKKCGYLNWRGVKSPVNTFIGCDPATDIETRTSDFSVIMVVAYDNESRLFVLEYVEKLAIPQLGLRNKDGKLVEGTPLGIVDYIFDLYDKYHCQSATIEDVSLTRGVIQDMQAEQLRRNRWDLIPIPFKPGGRDKVNRIVNGLNSMFATRRVHLKGEHYSLREQIENVGPKMKHDDVVDALYLSTRNLTHPSNFEAISNQIKSKVSAIGQRINWKTGQPYQLEGEEDGRSERYNWYRAI